MLIIHLFLSDRSRYHLLHILLSYRKIEPIAIIIPHSELPPSSFFVFHPLFSHTSSHPPRSSPRFPIPTQMTHGLSDPSLPGRIVLLALNPSPRSGQISTLRSHQDRRRDIHNRYIARFSSFTSKILRLINISHSTNSMTFKWFGLVWSFHRH